MEPEFELPFVTRKMLQFEQATRFQLIIQSSGTAIGTLQIRGAYRSGTFSFRHTTQNNDQVNQEILGLSDIPLWVTVFDPDNAFIPKDMYVSINLGLNNDIVHRLASGFVSGISGIGWPTVQNDPSVPREIGDVLTLVGSNPPAGSECSVSTPVNGIVKVKAVQFTLVTSATAISRAAHLQFQNNGGPTLDFFSSENPTASLTRNYTCAHFGGAKSEFQGDDILIPIPNDIILKGDSLITTATENLQVGDNFSAMSVMVEKYIT